MLILTEFFNKCVQVFIYKANKNGLLAKSEWLKLLLLNMYNRFFILKCKLCYLSNKRTQSGFGRDNSHRFVIQFSCGVNVRFLYFFFNNISMWYDVYILWIEHDTIILRASANILKNLHLVNIYKSFTQKKLNLQHPCKVFLLAPYGRIPSMWFYL